MFGFHGFCSLLLSTPSGCSRCFGFFCSTFLAVTMQEQAIWNVPYIIELCYFVKLKLKNPLSCFWQIEVRDRNEPRYGVQRLHWGQEWHWKPSFTLSHMTLFSTLVWWSRHHPNPLQTLNVKDCAWKKQCTAHFWEENKHGCTEHLTLHLLSKYLYDGIKTWYV